MALVSYFIFLFVFCMGIALYCVSKRDILVYLLDNLFYISAFGIWQSSHYYYYYCYSLSTLCSVLTIIHLQQTIFLGCMVLQLICNYSSWHMSRYLPCQSIIIIIIMGYFVVFKWSNRDILMHIVDGIF